MHEAIEALIVGHSVPCSCCPVRVRLLNKEGVKGHPENDYLEPHNNHIPGERCSSHTIRYKSHRSLGLFYMEAPPHSVDTRGVTHSHERW